MSYSATRKRGTSTTAADPEDGGAGGGDGEQYPHDLDELHSRCVRWFEEAERATWDEREQSEQARDYKSGVQWTKTEVDALRERHQPVTTINHVSRKIDLLCGLERKARTDPKAFPRTPTEEDRADAATQVLRYVTDDCDFPIIRSAVYENMLVEGFGGAIIDLEDDGQGGCDIIPRWVAWDRLWRDPHSRMPDFSDARYKGLVIWMDKDQLEETYPDAEEVTADSFASHSGTTYDDRPGSVSWQDSTRQRCRVAQCHWVERGEWWEVTYTRAGILVPPQRSPLKDRKGKAACRLIMQSAYVDRENKRFGIVRDMISPQDEINKRRSKALHLLSTRLVISETGAVEDEDKARREVAKPDGFVTVTPGMRFEIAQTADLAAGQMKLLEHATQEMQASGPNASMMGNDDKELSGRAILANQAGGVAQNEPLADSLRFWSRNVYEMVWMGARQYWSAGKWVRVTDDLGSIRWVGINRQVMLADELAEMPEQQRAMAMQQMQMQPNDPRLQQVIRVENDISDLDVDITIEEGQAVPTLMAEDFQALVQLASIQPGLIPGEVLIAASSLRNKDKLLEMMQQHQQAQAQQQQQAGQMAQQHAAATIQGVQAKAAADAALAKERGVNVLSKIHGMHADFNAPPYGQPNVAPDAPSAPGTSGALPIPARAAGGLVTRTVQPDDFTARMGRYWPPGVVTGAPMPVIDPSGFTADPRLAFPGGPVPPPDWVPPPTSHAAGGPIAGMTGGDPPGPDDGFITAKEGEYVMQRGAVARYGQPLMDMINAGELDPGVLQTAAAHAEADLRAKNAKAATDVARARDLHMASVKKAAEVHAILNPPPPMPPRRGA